MPTSASLDWVAQQRRAFGALVGRTVVGYSATEMAFVEEGPDGVPVFGGADAPFRQLDWLRLHLSGGDSVVVQTYQADYSFGLCKAEREAATGPRFRAEFESGSIFRAADLTSLPSGEVERVEVELDGEGEVSVVSLAVAGSVLELVAGEVHERRSGPPAVHFGDESVLVFTDRDARRSLMGEGLVVSLGRW